jgi:hypothetical protein
MTMKEQITQAISTLMAAVNDVESAEKGKLQPSVRARKEILDASKILRALRKDLLQNAKEEKAKRKAERDANPKKRYATGFALKKNKV